MHTWTCGKTTQNQLQGSEIENNLLLRDGKRKLNVTHIHFKYRGIVENIFVIKSHLLKL